MKKILVLQLIIICVFLMPLNIHGESYDKNPSADGVILMDAETGDVLYSKNPDEKYYPASTTKILTMLLTLESCKLDELVEVPREALEVDGSRIGLLEGEHIKVIDLLYGLVMESGNDCAIALATHISGSVEKFADLMNKKALELGCKNSHFANPHGLYDENHYTTPRDLALIMKELYKRPIFKEISQTVMYKMPPTDLYPNEKYVNSTIKLIIPDTNEYYPFATGGKTGWTSETLNTFVGTAEKDGMSLITTFLHDETKNYYVDAKNLFEYGFNNFERKEILTEGEEVYTCKFNNEVIPLLSPLTLTMTLPKGSEATATYNVVPCKLENEVVKGEVLAFIKVLVNGEAIKLIPLTSDKNIIPIKKVNPLNSKILIYILALPLLLIIIVLIAMSKGIRKRRKIKKVLNRKYCAIMNDKKNMSRYY